MLRLGVYGKASVIGRLQVLWRSSRDHAASGFVQPMEAIVVAASPGALLLAIRLRAAAVLTTHRRFGVHGVGV